MSDNIGKLISMAMLGTGTIDQITLLGIEYQANNITAERFSLRVCEIIASYQRQSKELEKSLEAGA